MEDESSRHSGYGEMYDGSLKNDPGEEIEALRDQTLECIEMFDADQPTEESPYFMSPKESTQLFTFFTMAAAVTEELSIGLLAKHLTDTETSSEKSSTEFFQKKFNQKRRQNLLFHTGIVGAGTKGEMEKLRNHRNTIVHDHRERKLVYDIAVMRDRVNGGYRAVDKLWDKIQSI